MNISFPIENDFDNSTKIYEAKIIKFYKSLFLLAFLPFKNFALTAIGIRKIIDTNWLNYAKIKQDKATKFPIHPLLKVSHIHKILIFNKWIINLDHFTFILLRKFFIVGDKKIYPECLLDHFFLKVLYEINHAFYINSIVNYIKLKDRIGAKPYYFELDKLQSFDIDWEEDFRIAEKIFNAVNIEF
jgi:hypothetical protein